MEFAYIKAQKAQKALTWHSGVHRKFGVNEQTPPPSPPPPNTVNYSRVPPPPRR